MSTDVQIPNISLSGFYYAEILDDLLSFLDREVPEVSTRSPYEPAVQLMRAFAFVGHLNNTLLDIVANEETLSTAKLRESVVRQLALIGYVPLGNVPALAEMRAELVAGFTTSTTLVSTGALFGTRRQSTTPSIVYESPVDLVSERTDILEAIHTYDDSADVWASHLVTLNADASTATVFSSPAVGDALYLCHADVLTNTVAFTGITGTKIDLGDNRDADAGEWRHLVWEFCNAEVEEDRPDTVEIDGAVLRFVVEGLLDDPGSESPERRLDGLEVRVSLVESGAFEWGVLVYDTVDNVHYVEVGYLGQSSPSTDPADYVVGRYWQQLTDVSDETRATISVSGEVFAAGDGTSYGLSGTLARYPIEPDSVVTWTWTGNDDGAYTASYNSRTGTWTGDVDGPNCVASVATGAFTVYADDADHRVKNATNLAVSYSREQQPFQVDGEVSFSVPFDATRRHDALPLHKTLINPSGTPSASGYWLRARLVMLGKTPGSAGMTLDRVRWDQGKMFARFTVVQGRTTTLEVVGSGTGEPNQSYALELQPVIEGSIALLVGGEAWTVVSSFASSESTDKHYTVRIDSDGVGVIACGDGINGKPFPVGTSNVLATYRTGGDDDGNAGAGKIVLNRSGIGRLRNFTNPQAASGWRPQEGAVDELALAKLKRDGVASLRNLERAISDEDFENLAVRWVDTDGSVPFGRAFAIPGFYGPSTVRLVVVPSGGVPTGDAAQRERLEVYFNGDLTTGGTTRGVAMIGTETTVTEVRRARFLIRALLEGGNPDAAALRASLHASLQPESLEPDGSGYRWRNGATVSLDKLRALLREQNNKIEGITFASPGVTTDQNLEIDQVPGLELSDIEILVVG